MAKLVFLGTADAIPDENHENAHLAILGDERKVLVDCPGTPLVRLHKAGIEILKITDLIITHFHPDHVNGIPNFLMDSWLLKRKGLLNIYGNEDVIAKTKRLMDIFDWGEWQNLFPIVFHIIPKEEMAPILEAKELNIYASPVQHVIPNTGLRIEFSSSGKVLVYSSDTEPCDEVVRLAVGADVLIHEAAGTGKGHTSAREAGRIAQRAGVKQLYLIHYSNRIKNTHRFVEEAKETFSGPVILAEDLVEIEF